MPELDPPQVGVQPVASARRGYLRQRSWFRVLLEVALISGGVFLGLAGDAWREDANHRELAQASLRRFRAEFEGNRQRVGEVALKHAAALKAVEAYFAAHGKELTAHMADPRTPLPGPWPSTATWPPAFQYSAWDVALATQALAYMDAELAASIAYAYRAQLHYDENVYAITQTMYSFSNQAVWLRSFATYVGDAVSIDDMMIKIYDDALRRIDAALGVSPAATGSK